MAYIRHQATLTHQFQHQNLLGAGALQIEDKPLQLEE
jgi:6,7-dimethyl-8-ribityllumazine synthase